jgi:hypothetical protein
MIKYIFYTLYNLVFQGLLLFYLVYANTYQNEIFIPDSIMWNNDNKLRTDTSGMAVRAIIQTLALIAEATILILIIYLVNKLYLKIVNSMNNQRRILNWTLKGNIILTICFIGVLIWGSFSGYLW